MLIAVPDEDIVRPGRLSERAGIFRRTSGRRRVFGPAACLGTRREPHVEREAYASAVFPHPVERRRPLQPILENLEVRLVLSDVPLSIQPTVVLAPAPGSHPTEISRLSDPGDSINPPVQPGFQPYAGTGPSGGYSPQQIWAAYGSNDIQFGSIHGDGSGQTIALVDFFDDPALVDSSLNGQPNPAFSTSDLAVFDQAFNLPDPPSFIKVGQDGSSNLPSAAPPYPSSSFAIETSLDVEWAHAMAPKANIVLVEANSIDSQSDVNMAIQTAASMAQVVSMSFGSPEYPDEIAQDSLYAVPGVTFLAATGDSGAPGGYAAYSPNVVAVGGTSLYLNGDNSYNHETVWNNIYTAATGGGVSQFEPEPTYQQAVQSTGQRTIPDVSFDGDPETGVSIYDSYDSPFDPWLTIGGTSLAAPAWAGLIAIADQGRALMGGSPLTGYDQTLPALYSLNYSDFNDITVGNNNMFGGGFTAKSGYDEASGLGSPKANLLVPDLAAYGLASKMAVTFGPPASVIAGDGFGVIVSAEDSSGNVDTSFNGTATISLASGPPGVAFSPITADFVAGQAVFDGLDLSKPADGYEFTISSPDFASVTTDPFDVVANPTPGSGTFYPVPTDQSLRQAIIAADSNNLASNTIVLGSGVYPLTNVSMGPLLIQDSSSILPSKTLTIVGPGWSSTAIEPVTAKGWASSVFEVVSKPGADVAVDFRGLSIEGGYATNGGILGGSVALGRRHPDRWRHGVDDGRGGDGQPGRGCRGCHRRERYQ